MNRKNHLVPPRMPVILRSSFMSWAIRGKDLLLARPLVMGILNVTPDSFSDGGRFLDSGLAFAEAEKMAAGGADILDLGAESTRPGAHPVSAGEELKRLLPVLQKISAHLKVPISIDTTKPEVAKACLAEGAQIINDVSGLADSGEAMARLVRDSGAGLVLMHRRGSPQTMQRQTDYTDVVCGVIRELGERFTAAQAYGIRDEQIILDPGFGFAKEAQQNFDLLKRLDEFKALGRPVLAGLSRKAFIGKVSGREAAERDFGTAAALTLAYERGARIFRVHNVQAARDVLAVCEATVKE